MALREISEVQFFAGLGILIAFLASMMVLGALMANRREVDLKRLDAATRLHDSELSRRVERLERLVEAMARK